MLIWQTHDLHHLKSYLQRLLGNPGLNRFHFRRISSEMLFTSKSPAILKETVVLFPTNRCFHYYVAYSGRKVSQNNCLQKAWYEKTSHVVLLISSGKTISSFCLSINSSELSRNYVGVYMDSHQIIAYNRQ